MGRAFLPGSRAHGPCSRPSARLTSCRVGEPRTSCQTPEAGCAYGPRNRVHDAPPASPALPRRASRPLSALRSPTLQVGFSSHPQYVPAPTPRPGPNPGRQAGRPHLRGPPSCDFVARNTEHVYSQTTPEALQPLEFVPFHSGPWYSRRLISFRTGPGVREPRPAFQRDTDGPDLNT